MKTILKSSIFKNTVIEKKCGKDLESTEFKESRVEINNEYIQGTIKEIVLNGVVISIKNIKTKNYSIKIFHDLPIFKLQFEIEGACHYIPINKKYADVYIPNGHYNLCYFPEVNGKLCYNTNYRKTLEILFTEKYIKKLIGEDLEKDLPNFGCAVCKNKPFLMWMKSKPISVELKKYIEEIMCCKYEGNIKKAYLETKINELLIFLLAKTNENNYDNIKLSNYDYCKIIEVEKYIQNNLKHALTISELAEFFGINMSKLKQNFKIVFSSTIFKHVTTLRMEKAKTLILNENYTVAEASYKVGYKNPQHFTVAFKKKYGCLPSDLIKE